jgi:hypothetical protein
MTNDELPNDERMTKSEARMQFNRMNSRSFAVERPFVIRHSGFFRPRSNRDLRHWVFRHSSLLLGLAFFTFVVGCGSGKPKVEPVRGKVTIDGQPLTEGTIVFHPSQGRPALGMVQQDGSYVLTTLHESDGALAGEHRVTIEARTVHGGISAARSVEEELSLAGSSSTPAVVEWIVPERFSRVATTPLMAKVESGQNNIDFDLKP